MKHFSLNFNFKIMPNNEKMRSVPFPKYSLLYVHLMHLKYSTINAN